MLQETVHVTEDHELCVLVNYESAAGLLSLICFLHDVVVVLDVVIISQVISLA